MKVEVLASVMNLTNKSVLKKMNLQTDAIIINQCDYFKYEEIKFNNSKIKILSLNERGVGLSRNNALMRASGDIIVFADEDETFVDDYNNIIVDEFSKHPNADMIIFNVPSTNPQRPTAYIKKEKRIHIFNCMKYGAVNIAIKVNTVKKNNIYFSLLFGGGGKYLSGEDSMFIIDIIKHGGIIYSSPKIIAHVKQDTSSWFNGYNEKYFISKGAFFYSISHFFWRFYCLQFLIRHKKIYKNTGFLNAFKLMKKGAYEIK